MAVCLTAWLEGSLAQTGGEAHAPPAAGNDASAGTPGIRRDLSGLSLEELANIDITSVSKRPEHLIEAPASVFVITNEAIRRSGATSLPEALRLAPNLQVAQINAQEYAINARGFNNSLANKLLVMIDGRIVYSPLHSGVFWDAQDVMLEDVDRIEVISGPGGTLWGTNAVNGVINVITRPAGGTQGALLAGGDGNRESDGAVRYGGTICSDGSYRVYGKYFDRDNTSTAAGNSARDGWNKAQAGFRADWSGTQDQFMLQGDTYKGDLDQNVSPARIFGFNLLSRWDRKLESGSSVQVMAYYDRTERIFPASYDETLDTVDVEFQHSLPAMGRHSVIWGVSDRQSADQEANTPSVAFYPAHLDQRSTSVFAQDEIRLRPDLRLILGTRLDRNDYTGLEVLPNARLAWNITESRMLWSAISRTVRSPSRVDRDLYSPAQPPYVIDGGSNFRSEVADVYEIGYRAQPASMFTYSLTGFYTQYEHLRTIELTSSSGAYVLSNQMQGYTAGVEAWGSYQPMAFWRLSAGLTGLRERLRLLPGSTDPTGVSAEGNDPAQTWQLRSSWDISANGTVDVALRHSGALPDPGVPSYTAVDARIGWTVSRNLEVSIVGQNLFGTNHAEFGSLPARSEIPSNVFVKLVWRP